MATVDESMLIPNQFLLDDNIDLCAIGLYKHEYIDVSDTFQLSHQHVVPSPTSVLTEEPSQTTETRTSCKRGSKRKRIRTEESKLLNREAQRRYRQKKQTEIGDLKDRVVYLETLVKQLQEKVDQKELKFC